MPLPAQYIDHKTKSKENVSGSEQSLFFFIPFFLTIVT